VEQLPNEDMLTGCEAPMALSLEKTPRQWANHISPIAKQPVQSLKQTQQRYSRRFPVIVIIVFGTTHICVQQSLRIHGRPVLPGNTPRKSCGCLLIYL